MHYTYDITTIAERKIAIVKETQQNINLKTLKNISKKLEVDYILYQEKKKRWYYYDGEYQAIPKENPLTPINQQTAIKILRQLF